MIKTLIEGFGAQLETALDIASKAELSAADAPITHVTVAGLGGSGIGGTLVSSWTLDAVKVPITTVNTYDIPAYVGSQTLFVACSFSGNTEETLSAVAQAGKAGAKVVCVTSGGKLDAMASQNGWDVIHIPGESKSPRSSIGYSFVQLLKILNFHGLTATDYAAEFKAAIATLAADQTHIQAEAKTIAAALKDKLPIIYADSKNRALAVRIQQQINENSKQFAHANEFPEMNHNELVGWENPQGFFKNTVVVLLRTDYDHERSIIRMGVCKPIFEEKGATVLEVAGKGASLIEQVMYLNHIFDWVSLFLAELNGADPFPVKVIDFLKGELAKH